MGKAKWYRLYATPSGEPPLALGTILSDSKKAASKVLMDEYWDSRLTESCTASIMEVANLQPRPVREVADDIARAWDKPYFGALPYLAAMCQIHSIDDDYGADDARSIVRYLLANASTFRGPKAKQLKLELQWMLELPYLRERRNAD